MFKFDTRDKKPTVWNIGFLTVCALAIVFILVKFKLASSLAVGIIVWIYLALVIILLVDAFIKQLKYNPYSYNTIYYSGFSLFVLSMLLTQIIVISNLLSGSIPLEHGVSDMISSFTGSARNYMMFSLPFVLIFSIGLCISNVSLIRHEGKRFVNLLGIILSIIMIGGEVFLFFTDMYASGSVYEVMFHDLFINIYASFYLYYECMIIGIIITIFIVLKYRPDKDKDYMIILGCGIRDDGTPSPLLKGRVDKALEFYREQLKETGKELKFVPSGGQGPDEVISESESMKRYLMENGISEDIILCEDKSTNTFENMKFSKGVIEKDAAGKGNDATSKEIKIAFSTTNYHVFRSGLLARRVKMRALGIGARTKWYFWPNATVREFVGLLTEHRLKQGLILGGIVLAYVILTVCNYLLEF